MAEKCEVCEIELPAQIHGRPRKYCSPRCRGDARVFEQTEELIESARKRGDHALAERRAARLARQRADARNGWAEAKARVEEINRRLRERR